MLQTLIAFKGIADSLTRLERAVMPFLRLPFRSLLQELRNFRKELSKGSPSLEPTAPGFLFQKPRSTKRAPGEEALAGCHRQRSGFSDRRLIGCGDFVRGNRIRISCCVFVEPPEAKALQNSVGIAVESHCFGSSIGGCGEVTSKMRFSRLTLGAQG